MHTPTVRQGDPALESNYVVECACGWSEEVDTHKRVIASHAVLRHVIEMRRCTMGHPLMIQGEMCDLCNSEPEGG